MNTNSHSLLQQALEFYKNERYDESLKIFDDQLKIKEIDIESFKNKKCIIFNLKKVMPLDLHSSIDEIGHFSFNRIHNVIKLWMLTNLDYLLTYGN